MEEVFKFKQFSIAQSDCAMKVGTDGVLLGAWTDCAGSNTILDIGTGTGVIALMIAQRNADADIMAIEIDEQAAQQAQHNVDQSDWSKKITVINQSIQDFQRENTQTFDHIVTNPPFFTGGTLSRSQDKSSVRHTTKLSHNDLLGAIRNLLTPSGTCSLILPDLEGYRCIELARTYNLYPHRVTEVYPDQSKPLERLMITLGKKEEGDYLIDKLYIRDQNTKDFSEQYKELTKDFYLKF
jgi:tRNA1Val (adenine37-N6)-methyltransferase